mgnify:CR=1 FL=1
MTATGMSKDRLNLAFITDYADKYAAKVCDIFFKTSDFIDGKQILHLANVKQVNMFVVKEVYQAWQKEASEFESPWFDYNTPQVREIIKHLMNVLSQNIRIEREDFEPLFRQAVYDTIVFTLKPSDFLKDFFEGFEGKIHVDKQLSPLMKYFKVHARLMQELSARLRKEEVKVKSNKALKIAQELCAREDLLDDQRHILNEFAELLPLAAWELYLKDGQQEETPPSENTIEETEPNSAADMFGEKPERSVAPALAAEPEKEEKKEKKVAYDYADFGDEAPVNASKAPESTPEPQPQATPAPDPEEVADTANNNDEFNDGLNPSDFEENIPGVTQAPTPAAPEQEPAGANSGDGHEKEEKADSLYSRLKKKAARQQEEEHITETTGQKPVISAKTDDEDEEDDSPAPNSTYNNLLNQMKKNSPQQLRIPLNMRYKFQNELFKGDHTAYEAAVADIDKCETYQHAMSLIKQKYFEQFDWDFSDPTTIEFLNLVDEKYAG